jgi:cytochrome c2
MKRGRKLFGVFGLLTTAFLLTVLQPVRTSQAQSAQQSTKPKSGGQQEGEMKFQQNCSRCHNAPESISPRIAGTVVRHMRVRASLSKQDAEAILHFLNP